MTGESSVTGGLWRPSHRQIVQGVLGMLLAITLVAWWLPRIAGTTWSAVYLTLSHVDLDSVMTLFALMCLGLWSYTFTLTGSLPGLRHLQALIVNVCGSSAGNLLPGGGAAGVAVTYAVFRSWGFSRRAISTSIVVTGVWNLLARMVLPVTALIALLVGGATCLMRCSEAGSPACQGELRPTAHSKSVTHRARFGLIPDAFFNSYTRALRWSDGSFTATQRWPYTAVVHARAEAGASGFV